MSEQDLQYPRELVQRHGAKAGILEYVAEKLPDIPQMPMVVSEIGEETESILYRADKAEIKYPRLFRSSAQEELLGYEGDFRTEEIEAFDVGHERVSWNPHNYSMYRNREYFEIGIKEVVDRVRYSPQRMKERDNELLLPDEINVIVTQRSPSNYAGTLIKHPNRDDFYLATFAESSEDIAYAMRETFYRPSKQTFAVENGKTKILPGFTNDISHNTPSLEYVAADLEKVVSWHDRIANLEEMDKGWSYQLEFGLHPPVLYQVRPFKPMRKTDFHIEKDYREYDDNPIVIGTTPADGIDAQVVTKQKGHFNTEIDLTDTDPQAPKIYNGYMRDAAVRIPPNLAVNLFHRAEGFLAHGDIKAMRPADVTALYQFSPPGRDLQHGEWVHIRSDGTNVEISSAK